MNLSQLESIFHSRKFWNWMKIINNNKDCQSEISDEFGFIFPKIWNVIGLQTTDVQWYLTWLLLFQILFNSILPNLLTFISNNKEI